MSTNGIVDNPVIVLDLKEVIHLDDTYKTRISALRFGWLDNVGCWEPYWNHNWTSYGDEIKILIVDKVIIQFIVNQVIYQWYHLFIMLMITGIV